MIRYLCTMFLIYTLTLISCTPLEKTTKGNQVNNEDITFGYINPNTFQLYDIAEVVEYGYTSEFPVRVGGRVKGDYVLNERRYLYKKNILLLINKYFLSLCFFIVVSEIKGLFKFR